MNRMRGVLVALLALTAGDGLTACGVSSEGVGPPTTTRDGGTATPDAPIAQGGSSGGTAGQAGRGGMGGQAGGPVITTLVIPCGNVTCNLTRTYCCYGGGGPACIPLDKPCTGAERRCDGPEDCVGSPNALCCARAAATGEGIEAHCMADGPCVGGAELCHAAADCNRADASNTVDPNGVPPAMATQACCPDLYDVSTCAPRCR